MTAYCMVDRVKKSTTLTKPQVDALYAPMLIKMCAVVFYVWMKC